MKIVNVTEGRFDLDWLIEEATISHQPIVIKGKSGKSLLVSEEHWNGINETLHLVGVPGLRESVIEGIEAGLEGCSEQLDW